MSSFPKIFFDLVEIISRFPGIGKRSAERIAFFILKMKPDEVKQLTTKIEEVYQYIKPCRICNNFSTQEVCSICSNSSRDKSIVCIVEEPKDILAIEKTSQYRGVYYVLLGSISPLEGITEEELNLRKLLNRLERKEIKEIIIATDPDNEGELTAQFLIEKISPYKVKIYRIAIGIPLGTQIEYIDSATLGKAILEKKAIS
jgi:recombination protein RecR